MREPGRMDIELTDGVITVRTPVEADAAPLAAAVQQSMRELAPFMPWAISSYGVTESLKWIRHEIAPDEVGFVIIEPGGEIVGSCGLNGFSELNRFANLGYWVRSDMTGRGHAARATRLLADHALRTLGLARIEILMSVENHASRRVAERVGARFEGRLRSRLLLHGRHHDADLFSLIATDNDHQVGHDDQHDGLHDGRHD
jgi:ribosomal-protein-serine acetyltransferase